MMLTTLIPLLACVSFGAAAPAKRASSPIVTIAHPQATIVGATDSNVETFVGIPFAQPPTGSLRLKPPQPLTSPLGTVNAIGIAPACPQFYFSTDEKNIPTNILGEIADLPIFQTVQNAKEDCLTLDIVRPAGATADSKLPVLFWIYGGGFELGSTQIYNGGPMVSATIAKDKPIIYVAANYRVGGFGFLPGKEVLEDGASNLGLIDQRLALQWVADNIEAFGGDPDKVTIWGESAGSISVMDQMLLYDGDNTYNGKPLFRAGIMDSGSVVPANPVDTPSAQVVYDTVVKNAGCDSASDTLECLRELDYTNLLNAANSVPGILGYYSVDLAYLPRPDGKALTDSPDVLVEQGKYAKVPFIIGDQEDEGTIFALSQSNLTTIDDVVNYLSTIFFHNATREQIQELVATYPDDPEHMSPFRTSDANNWYPQFMRLAAILGDLTFTLTRRVFLTVSQKVHPDVPFWSYLASYDHGTPFIGTCHGSDIVQVFFGILPDHASQAIHSYYLSFIYDLDPNEGSGQMEWPQWSENQTLVQFFADSSSLLADDFRDDTAQFLLQNEASFRV
ncbi:cholinesterase [Paecilomyces variotii No. 5]|uniref:Carboxylic ester hydrolase n=1 Tax=Byssochlamys spectabilis (strain No. 5 / NBRC 109023) TaxID=1356009 RepID=V5FZ78_BYSSN|nr:cholinesterase [Paecilomyces variotii No. 5]